MRNIFFSTCLLFLCCACEIAFAQTDATHEVRTEHPVWLERFDSASKGAYLAAPVKLSSGNWLFEDALIGNSPADHIHGGKGVRMQRSGNITMLFDVAEGITEVSVSAALFGTDGAATWQLQYSIDSGKNWVKAGNDITVSSDSLCTYNFWINKTGSTRLKIQKTGGGRLNIDDVSVCGGSKSTNNPTAGTIDIAAATRENNMALGNPSNASTSVYDKNNYLVRKDQFCLAYNNSRGGPNWVSWHLSNAWKGNAARCNCFNEDVALPYGFLKITKSDYTGSGFDRGHQCPSDDRDGSAEDNTATFLMDNMLPQAPHLNQQTWEHLETYCRTLCQQGNELYIIAGGYGTGGTGANGYATVVSNGKIVVPAHCWKVIVVLPNGSNDVSRVSSATRIIAVDMPNTQSVNAHPWGFYRTSTDAIEAATGYDLLSNIPAPIQKVIEAQVDKGPTQ